MPLQSLVVQHQYHDAEGVRQARYTAKLGDGSTRSGVTDAAGKVQLDSLPAGPVAINFEPDGRGWKRLGGADNPGHIAAKPSDADIDKLIDQARGGAA